MFVIIVLSLFVFGVVIIFDDIVLLQFVVEVFSVSVNDGQCDDWWFSIFIISGEIVVLGCFDGILFEVE